MLQISFMMPASSITITHFRVLQLCMSSWNSEIRTVNAAFSCYFIYQNLKSVDGWFQKKKILLVAFFSFSIVPSNSFKILLWWSINYGFGRSLTQWLKLMIKLAEVYIIWNRKFELWSTTFFSIRGSKLLSYD